MIDNPIKSRKDLKKFIKEDKKALGKENSRARFLRDFELKFQIALRKAEYSYNVNSIFKFYYLYKYRKLEIKYLTFIPLNTCDYGLSIAHLGNIHINGECKIGKYFRIHEGCTIGSTNGSLKAPIIGDYVFCGSGARVIGDINICDHVCIGALCLVIKSINEVGTYGGVPSKRISNNNSDSNLLIHRKK